MIKKNGISCLEVEKNGDRKADIGEALHQLMQICSEIDLDDDQNTTEE